MVKDDFSGENCRYTNCKEYFQPQIGVTQD